MNTISCHSFGRSWLRMRVGSSGRNRPGRGGAEALESVPVSDGLPPGSPTSLVDSCVVPTSASCQNLATITPAKTPTSHPWWLRGSARSTATATTRDAKSDMGGPPDQRSCPVVLSTWSGMAPSWRSPVPRRQPPVAVRRSAALLPGLDQLPAVALVARVLNVEVELELVRVRAQPDRVDLVLALVLDPGVDEVLGEDATREQVVLIGLKRDQHFAE